MNSIQNHFRRLYNTLIPQFGRDRFRSLVLRKNTILLLATTYLIAGTGTWVQATFDHSHKQLTEVLQKHVSNDLVDYKKLKKNPAQLDAYLSKLAAVKELEFKKWSESQRIAFLINLYNAATLKLIIDHYPIKSIKDIGWLLKGPWDQEVVRVFGRTTTLNHVEHKILRKEYSEPRIHFALVCAARGCPPLLNEAYDAYRLNEQLNSQGKAFLRNKSKNRVDASSGTLYLSQIFNWFEKDFTKPAGTLQNFVSPYLSKEDQEALSKKRFRIRHTDYDWSLNDGS